MKTISFFIFVVIISFLSLSFVTAMITPDAFAEKTSETCNCDRGSTCVGNGQDCNYSSAPYCIEGYCHTSPVPDGQKCGEDSDCSSGHCIEDYCGQYRCNEISVNQCEDNLDSCMIYRGGRGDAQRCQIRQNVGQSCYDGACYADQYCIPGAKTSGPNVGMVGYCGKNQQGPGEPCWEDPHCITGYICNIDDVCEQEPNSPATPQDPVLEDTCTKGVSSSVWSCKETCDPLTEDDKTSLGPANYGCALSESQSFTVMKCCKKRIAVQLPSTIACDASALSTYASSIPDSLRSLASSASISCVSSASTCSSGIGYPAGQTIPGTSSVISCPSGGSYCCAATAAGPGPSTTDTCTTAGLGGATWSCLAPANCTSGVYYPSSSNPALYACPSDQPQFCCKVTTTGGTTPGSGTSPTTPSETCIYYGVSCKNTTDANEIVKQGSSETAPYKSGNQCGGNYHDVYECTNNTTGAKRLDPRPISASNGVCAPGGSWCAVSTNPCQKRGGLMGGVAPVPKCGNVAYDSAQASKTQAQGNPYCSKAYSVDYQCSDGSWESRTTGYAPGICDALPWCTTASTPSSGTGETCAGAPSAVGGNCPSTKPICNRSSTQGDCVAQASVANGAFCAKASACQSGTCTSQSCQSPAAPTPPPLSLDVYCPVIDSDGKPNTCYYSSSCPSGYTLKSNTLSHQACDQHTSGTNPFCCHKDTVSGTTGGALSPACPNVDTDGKPNSCADKGPSGNPGANCPAGYSYKNAPQGDSDCTSHRSVPSVCCHQGSGT